MEPMTLGSPNNSPATGNNPYLPCYLTGESDIPTTPRSNTLSPTKRRTLSFATSPGVSSPTDYNNSLSMGHKSSLFSQQQQNPQSNIQNLNSSLSTGPPKQGLFDSLREEILQVQTPRKSALNETPNPGVGTSGYNQTNFNQSSFNDSYLNQSNFNTSRLTSPISTYNPSGGGPINTSNLRNVTQFDNSLNQCATVQKYADFWVTVFGFSQSATSLIISHFSQCGSIIDKVFPTQQNSNWIHIKYSSRLECDKALNYNEKILNNNLMIGVTRCKDPLVIDKENLNDNSQYFKVRPLTQIAYKNKQCESAVVACPPAPQRSSGIMNKAMDLLFGW